MKVNLEVQAASGDARLALTTHDLSTFGISLRGATLPKGTRITLTLALPDDPLVPVALRGVVLGPLDAQGGARVKFLHPPVESLRRIHLFVTKNAKSADDG